MRFNPGPLRRLTLAIAMLALLGTLAGAGTTGAQPGANLAQTGRLTYLPLLIKGEPETIPPATVNADLSLRPVPLREVERGRDLSVEYRYQNLGATPLTARFSLFYPSRLINFEWVDAPSDGYISHDATRVIVEVRNVAPGTTRTGRINFLVLGEANAGAKIGLYAEYECQAGPSCRSNFAEVEVIRNSGEGEEGGTYTMSVSPDRGPPGTAHTFSGSYFRPGERYVTWLNTPSGVLPLSISGNADDSGRIRFTYGSGELNQAGYYSMVAHGQRSKVTNVGPFIVQINGQPNLAGALSGALALPASPAPAIAPTAAPAQTTGSGGLAGRILDGAGAGLAGVTVEVTDAEGVIVAVTRSRINGVYLVPTGLADGQYTVTARPGLDPAFGLYARASSGPLSVTSPELTAGVDLTLPAAGGLAGTVTAGGAGAGGVRVSAIGAGGAVVAADLTDATGVYSITNLPAGSYSLSFDQRATARAGLYGPARLEGQPVTAGQLTAVAPVALPAATTTGVISGKVSAAATGAGIEGVIVVITKASPAEGEIFASVALSAADGSYSSDPLGAGDYRVQFVTLFSEVVTTTRYIGEFYNDAPSFAESDPVSVSVGAGVTADAALELGGSISGTVTGDGAGPLAGVIVVARDGGGAPRGFALTDEAGAYTLRGLREGAYSVEFSPGLAADSASRSFYAGAYDAAPGTPEVDPVAVGAGAAVAGIDIALGRGAQIVGTVSGDDTGEPLSGVAVFFIRAEPGGAFTLAGVGLTDAAGFYSSPALSPGSYRLLYTTSFSPDPTAHTYQSEYFNNRATLAEASAVTLPRLLGAITRNVALARGGTVAGRVSAEDTGAGLAGVFVVASLGEEIVGGTITGELGEYSLEGLPAGEIGLSFATRSSPNPVARSYTGRDDLVVGVAVGARATQDVTLAR